MTIQAKFPGTCSKCGARFAAGASIEWTRGQAARHTSCQPTTSWAGLGRSDALATATAAANAIAADADGVARRMEHNLRVARERMLGGF